MSARLERRLFIVLSLSPALVLFLTFVAVPSVQAFGYSLLQWDGLSKPLWVGLDNFVTLFGQSDVFLAALWHNVFLIVAAGSCTLGLALLFASLIHRRVRGASVFRVAFFFPNVISSVAIALLWVLIYSATDFGLVNATLGQLDRLMNAAGLSLGISLPFPFTDSKYLLYSLVPMIAWMATGFYMVLFLAGMENIPESLYEAATLDGASGPQQFLHITLPLLREVLTVGVVFFVIGGLKFFDIIWVMENQWPSKDTHVMATLMYQKVFSEYDVGQGAAIAVVLFVIVFLATLATLRLSRKEAVEF